MLTQLIDCARAAGNRRPSDAPENLLSPARLVLAAACLLAAALMLAAIAGVARAQVQKGLNFQFAAAPAAAPQPQFHASHDARHTSEFGRDGAAPQRLGYAR